MEAALARLAGWTARRRTPVILVWLALIVAGAWFSLHQTDRLTGGGWEVEGSESVRASDLLRRFPEVSGIRFGVLVESASREETQAAVARARAELGEFEEMRPFGKPEIFESGQVVLVPILYTGEDRNGIDQATDLRRALVSDDGGASVRVVGAPAIWSNFQEVSKEQLATAEAIGFPLVLLILVAAFGTVVAAAAPLALGFVSVFLTGAVIYLLSRATEMSVFVTNMASMIGIGVAVDYSLFVVSRFRHRLHEGWTQERALREALATSGTAVVFSGATVVVSLAGLFLPAVTAVRSLAIGAIVVVSIAVLATITLLPALLAVAGGRIERLRVPRLGGGRESGRTDRFWHVWTAQVMRRPVVALVGSAAVMLALAAPVVALRTENHGLAQLPRDAEVREAMERTAELAGPGYFGPIPIVTSDVQAAREIASAVGEVDAVARVGEPIASPDRRLHLVIATLAVDPDSSAARDAYFEVKAVSERLAARRGVDAELDGQTGFNIDVEKPLVGDLWKIILFILALSYVVLLLLLRSVLLPLKAVVMNLLSVGAAYGVLVAVFQWGWLDWTGYDSPGYLETIIPAIVLAVTFGLSMDYEVFLLTRIRERYGVHGDNERAVAEGLASSARVITAAALIMAAVFGAFTIAGATSIKQLGVGLAVAILLDATVVRLVLVPATMRLLGDWNWWLPRPLARLLRVAPAG
ncbi:MAG TPA: MMPL family transporter [Gaiellaceae bacterium]|nr:MMPL family transporter [Gaiellaceae bacterium]